MFEAAAEPVEAGARDARGIWPGLAIVAGAAVFVAVLARPAIDGTWENHATHFWIVLTAAALNVALGYAVGSAASRRRDARLFLVALAFVSAAGFLGLHALATPGVLLDKNAGFELATPVGLAIASAFAAASGLPLGPPAAQRVLRWSRPLAVALGLVIAAWGAVSLAEVGPLSRVLVGEQLDGWQISLAAVGVVLYGAAAVGYFRLYRRRRAGFLLIVTFAFALLAEAMLVIAWARNWRVSWSPRFRVGVNSGEVLAGVIGGSTGHRKHGVVGDTVNLAARLEAQAQPGQVVVGAETAAGLPPGAVFERLPPLAVKGKSNPVDAFVLSLL